ncbi:MAG: winged helix-turn-helix domain-containing protein [Lysobacteraceae bacterium]
MRYRFGNCLLDTDTGELFRDGAPVPLRRQAFRLLQALIERAPTLVERDVLLDRVWGHDALSPNVLPQTISELRQALGDHPQSPDCIETRHRRGYRFIAPVTVDASASASISTIIPATPQNELTAAADAAPACAVLPTDTRIAPARWPRFALPALICLLALIAALGWMWRSPPGNVGSDADTAIAIGVFPTESDVPEWIPGAALELITQSLHGVRGTRVLRSEALGLSQAAADARWQHLMHDLLGAPVAVTGHWRREGDELALELSVIDLGNGRVLRAQRLVAAEDALDDLVEQARTQVLAALSLPVSATAQARPERNVRTRYWEALAQLAAGESAAAAEALLALRTDMATEATWLDPALIRALREAGRTQEAGERIAARLAWGDDLPLGERLRLQAEQATLQHQPEQAAAALRALRELEPDDVAAGLELAARELDALQGEAARNTLAALGRDVRARNDPRLALLAARLARIDGDLDAAWREDENAAQAAQRHGLAQLAANAATGMAATQRARGELDKATQTLQAALDEWGERLSPSRRADLQLERIALMRERGQHDAAFKALDTFFAESPPADRMTRARIEGALLYFLANQPQPARTLLDAARTEALTQATPALAVAWHNAAALAALEAGQIDAAQQAFETAFSLARSHGLAGQSVALQVNAGLLLARQRRFAEAEALWGDALEVFERLGDRRGQATCLGNLAAAASSQGRAERADELNTHALTLFRELKLTGPQARTAYNLGLSAMRAGRLSSADALLGEAVEAFAAEGQPDPMLQALAMQAQVRLQAGQTDAVVALLDPLDATLATASPLRRSHVLSARARLHEARGERESARGLHREALALRNDGTTPAWAALSELALLRLDLQDGAEPGMIAARAEALAQHLTVLREPRDAARAHLLVAEARLTRKDPEQAEQALEQARTAMQDFSDQDMHLDFNWIQAWLADPVERNERLRLLVQRATELGYGRHAARAAAALDRRTTGIWLAEPLPPYATP